MINLADIQSSKALIDDLAWPFDFDLNRADADIDWITLEPKTPFVVIAGESTGGMFLAYGKGDTESLPILYATSEGQAGRVASNLSEFLAVMMGAPYWRDLLAFSGNGDLGEIRKTAVFMTREYAKDYPELPEARNRILQSLSIPKIDDPIRTLHRSVHATDCTLVAKDGWQYQSLFNKFTSSQNPNWR